MFSKTTYVVINLPKEYLKYLVSSRPWSVHFFRVGDQKQQTKQTVFLFVYDFKQKIYHSWVIWLVE